MVNLVVQSRSNISLRPASSMRVSVAPAMPVGQHAVRCASVVEDQGDATTHNGAQVMEGRRQVLSGVLSSLLLAPNASAFVEDDEAPKLLCDAQCAAELASLERVTLPSGLAFQDIKVGTGPTPPVGYQIVVHYIAMTGDGKIFSNSLEKGTPYDIRVGTGQVVAGLDEGLQTMRAGGIRRVYVPGNLSFPKGLPSGPGRPRVPPASPVIFDVQLLYIPGLDMDDE
eukprot:jgi/Picsp_1/2189/NSC_05653-R1_probable fkbp-type peptidyl-prolyl cis-trans isomerase chloroplastic-like